MNDFLRVALNFFTRTREAGGVHSIAYGGINVAARKYRRDER